MQRRSRHVLIAAAAVAAAGVAFALRLRTPSLRTLTFGADGPPTLILLHGYGSSAARWEPFTRTIWLPAGGRYVFPDAPEVTVPPDGPSDGRAWWRLDLAAHIPPGRTVPDLSATRPPGLRVAAGLVRELVEDSPRGTVVLGGFSQGAMVASELTFMTDTDVDALVLLSGTIVDEPSAGPPDSPRAGGYLSSSVTGAPTPSWRSRSPTGSERSCTLRDWTSPGFRSTAATTSLRPWSPH